nr:transglycosylase domain-containing protein [Microbacterium lemovicicum]
MPDTKRTATGVLGGIAGLVGLSTVAGVLIAATVTPAIAVSGAAASSAITMFDNLPSILDIEDLQLPTTFWYTDPDGNQQVLAQFYDQNRSPVGFDGVAPVMYDSILSSEDPRYYQHGGIDLIGTSRALLQNARGGGETQGGSSISQQYVKNILVQNCESNAQATETLTQEQVLANCFTDATNAKGTDGIQRKLQEMRYAIALEQKYSKTEILLGYLNIANFGGTTYGIDAAARHYFGVAAKDLSLAQAAILAGVVQNPNTYRIDKPGGSISGNDGTMYNKAPDGSIDDVDPQSISGLKALLDDGTITQEQYLAAADGYSATKSRQLYVLSRLLDDGKITRDAYVAAAIEPITPNIQPATTGCITAGGSAYFCQYVKSIIKTDPAFGETQEDRDKALQRGGLNVYTTIDMRVQWPAEQVMRDGAPSSVEGMNFGAATVSLEASTGRILSITQNTTFNETSATAGDPNYSSLVYAGDKQNGGSQGFNAGSTFKIFTLVDWLEKGHSLNERVDGRYRVIDRIPNSCDGDWVNYADEKVLNFDNNPGYYGSPVQFTRDSLNTGYLAMASELDLCDIGKVANKMGVVRGDGQPLDMRVATSVIGINNVSPMAMAGAYATVANNGIYCQPKAIDRIVDKDGNDRPLPARTCTQVIDPKVAAAAASALQGVMDRGGTGNRANPYDGTPVLGKTGTHERLNTWMIESSTKVSTAAWVGNSDGFSDVFTRYFDGTKLSDLRYGLARGVQEVADFVYGGDDFPDVDSSFTRQRFDDLPNVIGQSIDQATSTLRNAGFDVTVGDAIDSAEPEGTIAAQEPGAGRAVAGSNITISPSNGQGATVPGVTGELQKAVSDLRSAGFGNVQPGTCTVDPNAEGNKKIATGTNPASGTAVSKNAAITVDYSSKTCP